MDVLPNAVHAFGGPDAIDSFLSGNMLADPGAADITGQANVTDGAGAETHNVAGAAPMHSLLVVVLSLESLMPNFRSPRLLDMHCWGVNPVSQLGFMLNGQTASLEREGSYFDLVQPYQHHTRNPDSGINCYSFALRPEEHQPSGSCNFSRIDNATLQFSVLSHNTVSNQNTAKVRVYATNTMFSVL